MMMISRRVEISIAGGGEGMVGAYLLVGFFLLSCFFFCNHAFIVFRYKKPHAALAMQRTKPVKHKT